MFSDKIKKAFTLIELLVGISIITIIILGATSIDYNRLNQKQKLEIFTNSIKADFETIRNNSLSGRGIGTDLDIPKKWRIDYSNTSSGSITSKTYDGNTWKNNTNLIFPANFYISKIRCLQLDGITLDDQINSGTGSIEFEGLNITFLSNDCTKKTSKILEISITHRIDTKTMKINTLNGLVEIK